MVRVVERVHVTRLDAALVPVDDHLDGLAHRAQVDRDVRRVGDQAAVGVEDRAGEVEPLLDVDRVRGRPQPLPHLLGDRHEQVAEDLQEHWVRLRRGPGRGRRVRSDPGEQQVQPVRDRGPPAGLDHRRRQVLGDDGGPVHGLPGRQLATPVERHRRPLSCGEHRHVIGRPGDGTLPGCRRADGGGRGSGVGVGVARVGVARVGVVRVGLVRVGLVRVGVVRVGVAGGDGCHGDGLDDDAAAGHQEGEPAAVGPLEGGGHLLRGAVGNRERGVGAVVAEVDAAGHRDARRPPRPGRRGRIGPTPPAGGTPRRAAGPPSRASGAPRRRTRASRSRRPGRCRRRTARPPADG